MKHCVLLSLLLALGCMHVHSAPMKQTKGIKDGLCEHPSVKKAAELAMTKINEDRQEGYIFALHGLCNLHMMKRGENAEVFYLTLDVVETNCSVLSRKYWKACEARPTYDTPVYGQCNADIYISKVSMVVRLLKYDCVVTPVPAAKVLETCPDCPSYISLDNAEVQKTLSLSLEKFNNENGLANRFALLKVNRATAGMAMKMYYNVEYTIQETTCARTAGAADDCPLMECEFAHKGFCKASLYYSPTDDASISVECEIYEPEAAEIEKKHHLLGGETDHSHNDTHTHDHDHDHEHAHGTDNAHTHDHVHDHTKSHSHHNITQQHADSRDHHHTHAHSHDHGHGHDHVHAHHAMAHNHSGDFPNQHHNYKHGDAVHTHEHDHELALDHDHKHAHLHEHEHHHHHHHDTSVNTDWVQK